MTNADAIRIIKNEMECVQRAAKRDASVCDRVCALCDLVLDDSDIICAYIMAIEALGEDGDGDEP